MKRHLIKSILLIVLMLLAIVLGIIIGNACIDIKGFSWLAASATFGLAPTTLDLSVLKFTIGLTININVAQSILLLAAILVYCTIKVKE